MIKTTKTVVHANFIYAAINSFSSKHEFKLDLYRNLRSGKREVQWCVLIVLSDHSVLLCYDPLSHFAVDTYKDRSLVMWHYFKKYLFSGMYWNALVDESLPKICYYQQNVPQHCYLLDTLGHLFKWFLNYIFCQISWNSNDWTVRSRQVSAKALSLNFPGNCARTAFNWVLSITKKNPRIAGFFCIFTFSNIPHGNRRLKATTHCVQLWRKIAEVEWALSK